MTALAASDKTVDAFLGGRVEAVQPSSGHHRSGIEAVLLAASLDEGSRGAVVDLGAGAGVAGLCVAARCPAASIVLVERDPVALGCAREALTRPANRAFAARVTTIETDLGKRAGLEDGIATEVIFNPPFRGEASGTRSPSPARAKAHVLAEEGLEPWFRAAAALLAPGGMATAIFTAEGLALVLDAARGRFGALDILPIAPREGAPAHRVLLTGKKGSRAPLRLLPPLVLHGEGSAFLPAVEAILRGGKGLATAAPAWRRRGTAPS